MKRFWCLSVLMVILAAAQSAQAIGRLTVELRPASKEVQKKFGVSSGIVELVLKNTGDQAIEVDADSIPPPMPENGRLTLGYFDVVGSDGKQAPYTSVIAESSITTMQTVVIPPKKTLVRQVNILKNYQLAVGDTYTIKLVAPVRYLDRPKSSAPKASSHDLRSLLKTETPASTEIRIDTESDLKKYSSNASTASVLAEVPCTDAQKTAFEAAKTKAQQLAVESSGYFTSQMYWTTTPPIQARFKNEARFVKWFNRHPDPYDGVAGPGPVYSFLRTELTYNPTRIGQMTVSCTCDDPNINLATDTAYVYPTINYVVHACPKFWAAPLIPTARDENSQAGTLLHEGIHFADGNFVGLAGHATGPTYQEAVNLAVSNFAAATKNPNNFKFYGLNQSW